MKIWELKNAFIKLGNMMDKAMDEENDIDRAHALQMIEQEWAKGEGALADKLEAMSSMLKNYQHMADACKAEKDKFARKQKTLENQISFIKDRMILPTLKAAKLEKVSAGAHKVSIRHSKSCEIKDMQAIPEEFIKVEERRSADKREMLKRLKEGESIPGVYLHEVESVQIK